MMLTDKTEMVVMVATTSESTSDSVKERGRASGFGGVTEGSKGA